MQNTYASIEIKNIIPYSNNAKNHKKRNIDEIKKSIQANGYIAPIIIDEDNIILAGHGRYNAIKDLYEDDFMIDVLKVNGLTEKQKKDYRLRDNKLSELSERNFDAIEQEIKELNNNELNKLFDFDIMQLQGQINISDDIDEAITNIKNARKLQKMQDGELENPYSDKKTGVTYEPNLDVKVELNEIINLDMYQTAKQNIQNLNINNKVKDFLLLCIGRFVQINFTKAADYYCNATKEEQKGFEEAILVIIDYNNAIKKGYIKAEENYFEQFLFETGDEE